MKEIIWRIGFTLSLMWIFREFKGWHIKLGWRSSKSTKYKHLSPYQAALEEISEWYE